MAELSRRDFIHGAVALGALTANLPSVQAQAARDFDIDAAFAAFMKDIGGSPADAGGKVVFEGSDPLLRSHFRIGACMAIPAMGAALGAAAIWRQRTGQAQDLSVDLRQAVWNVNPLVGVVHFDLQRAGLIPAFTGISDPYETPADAEVVVDAGTLTPLEAAERVLAELRREGYLPAG